MRLYHIPVEMQRKSSKPSKYYYQPKQEHGPILPHPRNPSSMCTVPPPSITQKHRIPASQQVIVLPLHQHNSNPYMSYHYPLSTSHGIRSPQIIRRLFVVCVHRGVVNYPSVILVRLFICIIIA